MSWHAPIEGVLPVPTHDSFIFPTVDVKEFCWKLGLTHSGYFLIDPDGLEKSIDVLFDMLISGGGFLSQSLFEHSPQYCTESHKSYFIGKISQAIELYRIAHVLDFKGKIDPDLEKGWNVKYLRAEAAYVKHCTVCPLGYYLDDPKDRKLSQLIGMLPKNGKNKLENSRKILKIENDVTREKLTNLLYDVTNFDPNENAVR